MTMTMPASGSLEVLIADDSALLRFRLMEMLSQINGIRIVGEARDVPEAQAAIRALRPEVVILDIQMPGGTGIDVLRQVKADYPETIVIMLTNHAEPQYRKRCAELKADYFLSKLTDAKLLMEISERLAAKREIGDE